jgi:two-component system, LytTR family, sensor kinase
MKRTVYIALLGCLICTLMVSGQTGLGQNQFYLEGSVSVKETLRPLGGILITTDKGERTQSDALGEFRIPVALGDVLIVEGAGFETVRYRVNSRDEVKIQVEGYLEDAGVGSIRRSGSVSHPNHQLYLDSALHYKNLDISKSVGYVAKSIALLDKGSSKKDLARSLSVLGEIYLYHQQYDLAIDNLEDAVEAHKTVATSLLLARAHVLNKGFAPALAVLEPLRQLKNMPPEQQVALYELLGDAKKGAKDTQAAIAFYERGLQLATMNQMALKVTDLNSKMADAYSEGNQLVEAETYYGNSLQMASKLAPKRALQEKEKVADFYNKKSNYAQEIALRKKSLADLERLAAPELGPNGLELGDTLTTQRINYKIANAYIAQDKYTEAIPFLERSIVAADAEDDLVVQKDATRKLSEVYKNRGDFNKALETYQAYVDLVDTLYVRKEQEISRAARFNREIASIQDRVRGLEQERELTASKYSLALTEQELSEERFKRQKWVIYSLLLGLTLMILAVFFFYRSNQQQKLANNLLALKSLRSQMNPHFIFNALNSVNNFIAKNDERSANRYLSDFSKLMRSVLEYSEEDFIPLPQELDLLELYVKLEHSRFSDKFDYDIQVADDLRVDAFQIPPMLLQPYIENAIWHGLRYKEEKGKLCIKAAAKNAYEVEITITDDGIGRTASAQLKTKHQKKQKSKGMGNIKQRVAILNEMYPNKVDIAITDAQANGVGTKVTLTLKRDQ